MSSLSDKPLKLQHPRLRGRRRARFVSAVRDLRRTLTFAGIMIAAGLLELTYLYAEIRAFWASLTLVCAVSLFLIWCVWKRHKRLTYVMKWLAVTNLALALALWLGVSVAF